MLDSILKNQGLTSREIATYTLLLERGEQPASLIAKNLKLSRSSCYGMLAKLVEQGLTAQINKNGVTYFQAADPTILLEKAEQKGREELNRISTLRLNLGFIPRQKGLSQPKSSARYFQGEAGIDTLLHEILSHPASVKRVFVSYNAFLGSESLRPITRTIGLAAREKSMPPLKILTTHTTMRGLQTNDRTARNIIKLPEQALVRKISPTLDPGIDLILSGDRVALISQPENFGILIESRLIAAAQAKIFDLAWRFSRAAD